MKAVKAVIMAGGQGSRLRPLTCDLPKPMVPMANRPMMEYIIELLGKHGMEDIAVTTWYLPEVIEEHFGDGAAFGCSLHYFVEDRPLGTAGSVKNAAAFLDGTFLVISGDALTDFDLAKAIAYHREKQALATLVLTRVSSPLEYGVVFINEAGKVERFLEKPSWGEVFSDTVNTGIYILEPEILAMIPEETQFDFSRDLFPMLLQSGRGLYGYVSEGYWSDIGNIEQYVQSHWDLLMKKAKASLPGRKQAASEQDMWLDEGVFIHPDATLEGPVVLGKHCRVERGATIGPYVVLGENTIVGQHSSIRHSILWPNVHVGASAEIKGAVICQQATVKSKARVFQGAVIGQGSVLGMSSTVRPRVKIWPNKRVDRLATVSADVVWTGSCARSLFGNGGITGLANLELSPEFSARIGASLGALHNPSQTVLVAADGWGAARMVKRALTAGLLSSGVDVVDIGSTTLPVTGFTSVLTNCVGAVYVRQGQKIPDEVEIRILDGQGFPLGRSQERALDNYFDRGDFRRVPGSVVGKTQFVAGANQAYLKALSEQYRGMPSHMQASTVVIGYTAPSLRFLLPNVLADLGCKIIDLGFDQQPGATPNLAMYEREVYLGLIADEVIAKEAAFGVLVDGSGELAILVDNNGEPLAADLYWPLLTWAVAVSAKDFGDTMAVPVTASHAVDEVAAKFQMPIVRTQNNARAVLQATGGLHVAGRDGELLHPAFDALAFTITILGLVGRTGRDLAELVAALPPKGRRQLDVVVPWQGKGKVMHHVLASTKDEQRDLIDGIKVYHEQGWALVLPDGEAPLVSVYTEASTYDEADGLAQMYSDQIDEAQLM